MKGCGRIYLLHGTWVLELRAGLLIRLRRFWPRVEEKAGKILIKRTEEVDTDLLMFLDRYGFGISDQDRATLMAGVEAYDARHEQLARALEGGGTIRYAVPLAMGLREYQNAAVRVALVGRHLLLADDLGLGKSATAIGALAALGEWPSVVVCETHLTHQWRRELGKFAPGLRVHIPTTGAESALRVRGAPPHVYVLPWSKLRTHGHHLGPRTRAVVFDEVQSLRRAGDAGEQTQKYSGALALARESALVMGLSATPIYGYGEEIFNVLEVLAPGHLGSREEFKREWCTGGGGAADGKARLTDPRAFGTYLRSTGLMMRRTRAEVGKELPPTDRSVQYIDTDPKALRVIAAEADVLAQRVLTGDFQAKGQAAREMDTLLRQATGIAKAPAVAEFVMSLLESEQRVLLYGYHRAVYDLWKKYLGHVGLAWYTGTESPTQKEASFKAFTQGDARVLIASLRSGAGLDGLQKVCRVVVFGELDWSPGIHEQCEGRLGRDEQLGQVLAYYLVSEEGSDPTVMDVLGIKAGQIQGLREPTAAVVQRQEDARAASLARAWADQRQGARRPTREG